MSFTVSTRISIFLFLWRTRRVGNLKRRQKLTKKYWCIKLCLKASEDIFKLLIKLSCIEHTMIATNSAWLNHIQGMDWLKIVCLCDIHIVQNHQNLTHFRSCMYYELPSNAHHQEMVGAQFHSKLNGNDNSNGYPPFVLNN